MAKWLLAAAWGGVLLGLALQMSRVGLLPMLRALGQGMRWEDTGQLQALPAEVHTLLWLAHAGALAFLWRLAGRSYPAAIALGLATGILLLLPQAPSLFWSGRVDSTPLTPLFVPYGLVVLWRLGFLPVAAGEALFRPIALGAAAYTCVGEVQRFWRPRVRVGLAPAAAVLLVGAGVWAVVAYWGGRTRGVTGSDPFCYAQMAVDLARHGDPRHHFTLFPLVKGLEIPWWPIVHVGYYPPDPTTGISPTVWPVGWPVLLAAGYRLLGETGLYVGAPVAGVLSLFATAALAAEIWTWTKERQAWLGMGLSVLILATSREQILQLLVPMADVPAQLFSALAVWLALLAGRKGSLPLAVACGVALGVAYDIRHTQVVLAPVVALALWTGPANEPAWGRLLAAGAGAGLLAAPDLWYHDLAFGSVWRPESPESYLIGLQHWWPNARSMARVLASQPEFGLLLPFLAYGFARMWYRSWRCASVLAAWVVINAGTQFLYGPLRWRDLLVVLPALAILVGYGITAAIDLARRRERWMGWAPGWLALCVALLLAVRSGPMLAWLFQKQEMTFGYLTAEQRQAFDRLGESVEPDAVIGTSLNSGPIELYTGREVFRPGDWAPSELETFLQAVDGAGKQAYILDDGNEHAAVVARLEGEGRLTRVRALKVPLYGDRSELTGMLYRIVP